MNVKKNFQLIFRDEGVKLVRVMHDVEIWSDNWRPGLPQVHPIFPNHFSVFSEPWQWCSRRANPRISDMKWTRVYPGGTFIANGQGFEMSGDPRNNYILGTMGREDPRVENLTTGGSVHMGYFQGGRFYFTRMLNVNGPVPTPEQLELSPWLRIVASNCDANHVPRKFAQGLQPSGEVVTIYHPFITNMERFPIQYTDAYRVQVWTKSWLPDPFTIYGGLQPRLFHG